MNCADFRRLASARGNASSGDLTAHSSSCVACRTFSNELGRENEVLRSALAVEVPPGLADRILLNRRALASGASRWLSLAGAVLVVAGCWLAWQVNVSRRVAGAMIEHVLAEPTALEAGSTLPTEHLNAMLALAGVSPRTALGQLRYAGQCGMLGGTGHHFVVDGPQGKATIIVGPPGATLIFSSSAARGGYYGEVLSGRGVTVGVIGADRRAVATMAATLKPG